MMRKTKQQPPQHRLFFKDWRKFRGLSQERLAERLDYDRSTVSRIERGTVSYTPQFLDGLSVALNCDVADLFTRPPDGNEAEIHDLLRVLNDEKKKQAVRVLKALAEDDEAEVA